MSCYYSILRICRAVLSYAMLSGVAYSPVDETPRTWGPYICLGMVILDKAI